MKETPLRGLLCIAVFVTFPVQLRAAGRCRGKSAGAERWNILWKLSKDGVVWADPRILRR